MDGFVKMLMEGGGGGGGSKAMEIQAGGGRET